jgi:hypothetical protein
MAFSQPKPLHHVRREGSLLGVRVQMHTLLSDDSAGVVLQVEEVPRVLGHLSRTGAVVWAGEVTHGLKALLPLGLILITDREERDRCIGSGGMTALGTMQREPRAPSSQRCHLPCCR